MRLKVKAIRAKSFEGMGGNVADCFFLSAINVGPRTVTIKGWSWCVGKGKRQLSMWSERPMHPRMIAYGEAATIDIDLRDLDYWKQIAEGLVNHCKAKSLKKVRVEVYTTTGSTARVIPDKHVLDFLRPLFEDAKRDLQSGK